MRRGIFAAYRRDGSPYPEGEAGLLECARDIGDDVKRVVRQETLPNGYVVSTVWLGFDHAFGAGPPLIFETMVFDPPNATDDNEWDSSYQARYATEDEAILGHMHAVDQFKGEPGRK